MGSGSNEQIFGNVILSKQRSISPLDGLPSDKTSDHQIDAKLFLNNDLQV